VRHLAAQAVWLRWRPPSLHLQSGILRVKKITVALVRKSEGRCISNKTASAQFLNRVCLTEVS
jgi:hypothetical protein